RSLVRQRVCPSVELDSVQRAQFLVGSLRMFASTRYVTGNLWSQVRSGQRTPFQDTQPANPQPLGSAEEYVVPIGNPPDRAARFRIPAPPLRYLPFGIRKAARFVLWRTQSSS